MEKYLFAFRIFLLLLLGVSGLSAQAQSLSLFVGKSNDSEMLRIIQFKRGAWEPYDIVGLGYRTSLFRSSDLYEFEWGGNIVKHLERTSLFEFDILVLFRWNWFPWNQILKTSMGIGEGLSYATGFPTSETTQGFFSSFLNYVWIDFRFQLPAVPAWSLDLVLHHRSGIYGLIGGVRGGSNYLCLGISHFF